MPMNARVMGSGVCYTAASFTACQYVKSPVFFAAVCVGNPSLLLPSLPEALAGGGRGHRGNLAGLAFRAAGRAPLRGAGSYPIGARAGRHRPAQNLLDPG